MTQTLMQMMENIFSATDTTLYVDSDISTSYTRPARESGETTDRPRETPAHAPKGRGTRTRPTAMRYAMILLVSLQLVTCCSARSTEFTEFEKACDGLFRWYLNRTHGKFNLPGWTWEKQVLLTVSHGIMCQHPTELSQTFIYVSEKLAESLNPQHKVAWEKILTFLCSESSMTVFIRATKDVYEQWRCLEEDWEFLRDDKEAQQRDLRPDEEALVDFLVNGELAALTTEIQTIHVVNSLPRTTAWEKASNGRCIKILEMVCKNKAEFTVVSKRSKSSPRKSIR